MDNDVIRDALTTPYVTTLIRVKALQLLKRPGFRRSERHDLEQDLRTQVLKMGHHYDPARGAVSTFIDRVVDSAAAMIIRDCRRLKRSVTMKIESLDRQVHVGEKPQAMSDLIDSGTVCRRLEKEDCSPLAQAERTSLPI